MIIARWSIEARFGHKQTVIDVMTRWQKEIGREIGWKDVRLLANSVGGPESTIQSEVRLKDLAELSASWDKLAKIEAHKNFGKELEPYIVSGTSRWEVFRVLFEES